MPVQNTDITNPSIKEKLKKPVHPYLAYGVIIGVAVIISLLFLLLFKLNYHPITTVTETNANSANTSNAVKSTPLPSATPTELEKTSTQIDASLNQSDQDLTNIDNALNDQMDPALQQ